MKIISLDHNHELFSNDITFPFWSVDKTFSWRQTRSLHEHSQICLTFSLACLSVCMDVLTSPQTISAYRNYRNKVVKKHQANMMLLMWWCFKVLILTITWKSWIISWIAHPSNLTHMTSHVSCSALVSSICVSGDLILINCISILFKMQLHCCHIGTLFTEYCFFIL